LLPLKDRKQDIPVLSTHFFKKYTRLYQKDVQDISPAAMQAMMLHDFPGNIRELENIIERAVVLCHENTLTPNNLMLDNDPAAFLQDTDQDVYHLSFKDAKDKMIHMFHRHYIQTLLTQSAGNISRAAQTAGIQRQLRTTAIRLTSWLSIILIAWLILSSAVTQGFSGMPER